MLPSYANKLRPYCSKIKILLW